MTESQEWFKYRELVIDRWPLMSPGHADEHADMLVEAATEQSARIRELEAALEPFAGQTERLEFWGWPDKAIVDDLFFTIADYKRVDTALRGAGAEGEGE